MSVEADLMQVIQAQLSTVTKTHLKNREWRLLEQERKAETALGSSRA
jgi:hypothetical protein